MSAIKAMLADAAIEGADRLGIGANGGPALADPLDGFRAALDDLADTTDGIVAPTTPEQAADVTRILDEARSLAKLIDEQRATEKRPHDDAAKAVQARWKPLLTRADAITETAKAALAEWLVAERKRVDAEAKAARDAADVAVAIAAKARATMDGMNLADREQVDQLTAASDKAMKAAGRAEKATANVKGDGKAVSLRTSYTPTVTDYTAFGRWAWANRNDAYKAALDALAKGLPNAPTPGIEFVEVRSVA